MAETSYCYDAADRLLATVGATAVTNVQYDNNGNTTQYTTGGATTHLSWDGADRNIAVRTTGSDAADVSYIRDATDRIVRRTATAGDTATDVRYGYTGSGDTADLAFGPDNRILSRSISLPGGALYTWKPQAADRTIDHPTVRGDLGLTTRADGTQLGALRTFTPFGEPLKADGVMDPDNVPDNSPGQMDNGWLGQHQRPYEHAGALSLVQMGARPYSPLLGRFLSVDPVEGGSANDYDYVNADAVNTVDLDGKCPICWAVRGGQWLAKTRFGQWVAKTAAPWVGRHFMRTVARPAVNIVRWGIVGARWAARTVKTRALETFAYVRAKPGRAAFRCGVFGGLNMALSGSNMEKAKAFGIGCVANLVHDAWGFKP